MEDSKPPRYMSDKAKGKQRVEPINLAALAPQGILSAPAQDYSPNIKFSVRFTDGFQDLRLELPPTKRVAAIVVTVSAALGDAFTMFSVSQIREIRPELSRRKLRLIHGGKSLAWTLPLSTLKQNRQPFVETVSPDISQLPSLNKWDPKDPVFLDEPVWIHCSVGDEIHGEEDEEEVTAEHVCGLMPFMKGFLLISSTGHDRTPPWFRPLQHARVDRG
jgi:hypothetical protein